MLYKINLKQPINLYNINRKVYKIMTRKADPRFEEGRVKYLATIPKDDHNALKELIQAGHITSINDGLLQALDYWLVGKYGMTKE